MTEGKQSPSQAEKGDEKAREADPHGTSLGTEGAEMSPDARPTSDRHKTETAAGVEDGKK
ncbi:MAG: hypothetical protein JOZ42_05555 [Acetobacteraceae bacterium]|nr:hypothetical protein [Acetobacteraceae bacterium]